VRYDARLMHLQKPFGAGWYDSSLRAWGSTERLSTRCGKEVIHRDVVSFDYLAGGLPLCAACIEARDREEAEKVAVDIIETFGQSGMCTCVRGNSEPNATSTIAACRVHGILR